MKGKDYLQIIWDRKVFLRSFDAVVGLHIKLMVARRGSMKSLVANGQVLKKKVIIKIKDLLAAKDNLSFKEQLTTQSLLGGRLLGLYLRTLRFKLNLGRYQGFWKKGRKLMKRDIKKRTLNLQHLALLPPKEGK